MILSQRAANLLKNKWWHIVSQFNHDRYAVFYIMYHEVKWLNIIFSFFLLLYRKNASSNIHSSVLFNTYSGFWGWWELHSMYSQIQTFSIQLYRKNASINIHFYVLLNSVFLWLMRIAFFSQIQKIFTHTGIETPHLHPSVVLQKKSQVGLG